jgi:hypothetical protein
MPGRNARAFSMKSAAEIVRAPVTPAKIQTANKNGICRHDLSSASYRRMKNSFELPSMMEAAKGFAVAALIVCFVNFPFWWLQQSNFIIRAIFNLDLIIALIIMTRYTKSGIALLLAFWMVDGFISVSKAFHYESAMEFLESARFFKKLNLNFDYLLSISAIGIPFILVLSIIVFSLRRFAGRPGASPLFFIFFLILTVDIYGNSNPLSQLFIADDMVALPINAGSSQSYNFVKLASIGHRENTIETIPREMTIQGKIDIPLWMEQYPRQSVLLVMVESLGYPIDPAKRAWLASQLDSPPYAVEEYKLPFAGSTVTGELRALCEVHSTFNAAPGFAGRCLPAKLNKQNIRTIAFHGFYSDMFDRNSWWPKIGFEKVLFGDSPGLRELKRCGNVFEGVCDSEVIANAVSELGARRGFAYVLTLNTHLPLQKRNMLENIDPHLQRLCATSKTPEEVCRILSLQGHVLSDAVRLASTLRPAPLLVILGDHSPPFSSTRSRSEYESHVVPAYVLKPRHASANR